MGQAVQVELVSRIAPDECPRVLGDGGVADQAAIPVPDKTGA